jgi:cobalt-zinc-cadmium efflux system membrane fusion protein
MSAPTVLLLDDDEVLRQVLRRVLSRQGLNVIEAADLAQARLALAKSDCKLGLFDLCLPDGDGVELAKEIQESGSTMPLILMTAYPLRLREQPNLAQKFTRVLPKPVNLQELREAVESALAGTTQAPATLVHAATPPTTAELQSRTAQEIDIPPRPPAPPPAAPVAPPLSPPIRGYLRPVVLGVVGFVVVAGLALFFFPQAQSLLNWNRAEAGEGVRLQSLYTAKAVENDPNALQLSQEVVEQMKIETVEVRPAEAHRPLQLGGSLALDPDRQTRVRSRFAGEVIKIDNVADINNPQGTKPRPLQFDDHVVANQHLGVVWSKDLGEKKSELVDAISQLRLDEDNLVGIEDLYKRGATTEVVVRQARRNVEQDQIAVSKAERTLRTWRLPDEEIDEVKREAERVIARKGQRDKDKEAGWARVDLISWIDGTIVEKNATVGEIVDTTTVLFQIADMTKLRVWINVPEEDLPAIRAAQDERIKSGEKLRWTISFPTAPKVQPQAGTIEAISPVIDSTQHTALAMGAVDNPIDPTSGKGVLYAGQFIEASITLTAPKDAVSIPSAALLDDGSETVVFVQPDPEKPVFTMKRVVALKRYNDVSQIKMTLTQEEIKKGYKPLLPGERVVSVSALELRAALEDVQTKAER